MQQWGIRGWDRGQGDPWWDHFGLVQGNAGVTTESTWSGQVLWWRKRTHRVIASTEGTESATESLFRHLEMGCKGKWPGSHIPSQLPTFSLQGCPYLVLLVQHEGIDPEGEVVLPPVLQEDSVNDILWCQGSLCIPTLLPFTESWWKVPIWFARKGSVHWSPQIINYWWHQHRAVLLKDTQSPGEKSRCQYDFNHWRHQVPSLGRRCPDIVPPCRQPDSAANHLCGSRNVAMPKHGQRIFQIAYMNGKGSRWTEVLLVPLHVIAWHTLPCQRCATLSRCCRCSFQGKASSCHMCFCHTDILLAMLSVTVKNAPFLSSRLSSW